MAGTFTSRAQGAITAGPLLVGAAVFAGLMLLADRMLGDPDTHWHIALGARIWRDGAVPWTDTYSHTVAGTRWIAKEWLSQLLLFGARAAAGWWGVVALSAAALAVTVALLFRWLARRLRWSLALGLTLLSVLFLAPHALARPHVLALPLLLVWAIELSAAAERREAPSPWLLGVLVLWANLHGSFTIAYPLAALLGADALLGAAPGRRLDLAGRWCLFGLGALGAGCVSPYGLHSMVVTLTIFGSGESLPFVTEWQPLAFDGIGLAALGLSALLALGLALEPGRNAVRLAALAMLTAMMLRHTRFLDLFALVAPVLAAGPLLRRFPGLGPEPDRPGARFPGWCGALGSLAVAALASGLAAGREVAPSASVTPAAALASARSAGLTGPVYNDYDFGGFLMAEGVPTFIDGRTDQLYLGGFISGLDRAVRHSETGPFLAILDRHRVTWALVRTDGREARHLTGAPGWLLLHGDPVATVFGRASPVPAALPSARPGS
ncbi:hypothetical protein [Enterovirga sp.]|uniref:hypothetical protein n=1 Tax=Enterovirga sp. TaxID=2026350 RepID=UPI0026310A7F|nr:hypothetical protein [Enterovirga sp.]MDB5589963.1 hypothetical protein [Enterovirga sp.]